MMKTTGLNFIVRAQRAHFFAHCATISLAVCAIALLSATPASALTKTLGGGWDVTWDSSLDPYVDVIAYGQVGSSLFIEKSAEFIQGPNPLGVFPAIPIVFTQTAANAATEILIDDEIILNNTGVDWMDFHFQVVDGGDVSFQYGPSGMFTTAPFVNQALGVTTFDAWGGIVPDGGAWFPGDGATDGELQINVNTGDGVTTPFVNFTLKEWPTIEGNIPEPASCVLACIGLLLFAPLVRRRASGR